MGLLLLLSSSFRLKTDPISTDGKESESQMEMNFGEMISVICLDELG